MNVTIRPLQREVRHSLQPWLEKFAGMATIAAEDWTADETDILTTLLLEGFQVHHLTEIVGECPRIDATMASTIALWKRLVDQIIRDNPKDILGGGWWYDGNVMRWHWVKQP